MKKQLTVGSWRSKVVTFIVTAVLVIVALVQPFVRVSVNADGVFVLYRTSTEARFETVFYWLR